MKAADGKVTLLNNGNEALDWLVKLVGNGQVSESAEADRWLMFRGNPQRNAIASGSAPLMNLCWESPATDDPLMEEVMRADPPGHIGTRSRRVARFAPAGGRRRGARFAHIKIYRRWILPAASGCGKFRWTICRKIPRSPAITIRTVQASLMAVMLSHRALNDATFGTLSSDGRLVFAIEELGPEQGMDSARRGININNFAINKVIQSACGIRHPHRQTQVAVGRGCRGFWRAAGGDFFPWSAAAFDGAIVRAGGNEGRNPPIGIGCR